MKAPDVTNFAVLLVIARYLNNNEVEENVLLCHLLLNAQLVKIYFMLLIVISKKWVLNGPMVVDYLQMVESQCRVYILVFEVAS